MKYPFTPGNESAATVQSLGEEVADEKKEIIVKHENVLFYP